MSAVIDMKWTASVLITALMSCFATCPPLDMSPPLPNILFGPNNMPKIGPFPPLPSLPPLPLFDPNIMPKMGPFPPLPSLPPLPNVPFGLNNLPKVGPFPFQLTQEPPDSPNRKGLKEVYAWSQFDFDFPSPKARAEAIKTGTFVPVNASAPAGVEVAGDRIFISLPRWKAGVPATLNTVPVPRADAPFSNKAPLLTPFPNWELNREGNCDGLTSVYRVKADECDRLWVLDTGTVDSFTEPRNICPPQVVTYDLKKNRMVHRYKFPASVMKPDSQLVTIEVEYPEGRNLCKKPTDAVLYVADTVGFGLIVVDLHRDRAWRVRDKTMYPSPEAGTFDIARETFELMDGVLALALSPRYDEERTLYFSAMNSFQQRWVSTAVLRNESLALRSPRAFHTGEQRRTSQAGDAAMDSEGVLFFGLLGESALACWNTEFPFTQESVAVLASDERTMQFPVSVAVDAGHSLWLLSTKFQSFYLGTLPVNGPNFRLFMAPSTTELIRDTPCEI